MKPFEEINEFELDFPEAETGPIGSDYDEYSDIDVVAVVEELEENDIMLLNYIIQYMVNEKRKQNRK
jgi:hypothetical protein